MCNKSIKKNKYIKTVRLHYFVYNTKCTCLGKACCATVQLCLTFAFVNLVRT